MPRLKGKRTKRVTKKEEPVLLYSVIINEDDDDDSRYLVAAKDADEATTKAVKAFRKKFPAAQVRSINTTSNDDSTEIIL